MPERLHERLLHDVVGLFPGPQEEGSPVCAQRIPGDQHGIRVKVAATGPGYRLPVVDDTPHSTGAHAPEYTTNGPRVLAKGKRGTALAYRQARRRRPPGNDRVPSAADIPSTGRTAWRSPRRARPCTRVRSATTYGQRESAP